MFTTLTSSILLLPIATSSERHEAAEVGPAPSALVAALRRDLEHQDASFGATLHGNVEWSAFDETAHRTALHRELVGSLEEPVAPEAPSEGLARIYFSEVLESFESGSFDGRLASTVRGPDLRQWEETFWLAGQRVNVVETVEVDGGGAPVVVHTANDGRLQLRREEQDGVTLYQELRLHEDSQDTRPTTVTLLLDATTRLEVLLGLAPKDLVSGAPTAIDLALPTALVERWREAAPSDTSFVPTMAWLTRRDLGGATAFEVEYRTRRSDDLLFSESLTLDPLGRPLALELDYHALGQGAAPVISASIELMPFSPDGSSLPGPLAAADPAHELVDTRGGAVRQVVLNGTDVQNETAARMVGPWRSQALLSDRVDQDVDSWSVPVSLEDGTLTARRYSREELTRGPLRLLLMQPDGAPAQVVDVDASCDCFELAIERDGFTGQPVLIARLREGYEPADRVSINLAWANAEAAGAVAFTRLVLVSDERAPETSYLYGLLGTAQEDEPVQQGYPLVALLGEQAFQLSSSEIAVTAVGDLTVRPLRWVEDASGVGEVELEFGRLDRTRYGALEARVELRRRDDGSLLGAFAVLGTWLPSGMALAADETLRFVPGPSTEIDTGPRLDFTAGRIEGLDSEHWSVDQDGRLVVAAEAPAGGFVWTDEVRTIQFRVR